MSTTVKIKRLSPAVPFPAYAYEGDAAFDLCSAEDKTLAPGERHAFHSGLQLEIPEGYVGLIWDKSGIGIKGGLKTLGGVVDCGYRGEVMVGMINLSGSDFVVERRQKLAQMIIQKTEKVILEEADALAVSERGERGFGSSGK